MFVVERDQLLGKWRTEGRRQEDKEEESLSDDNT
tara:strand:- start:1210 stop:1311 length:102 start_codon:yes stop_codon:yes gene_type:complete